MFVVQEMLKGHEEPSWKEDGGRKEEDMWKEEATFASSFVPCANCGADTWLLPIKFFEKMKVVILATAPK